MTTSKSPAPTRPAARPGTRQVGHRAVLVFHLAGQGYALPLQDLQEVVPMAELSRPPGMPSALAGFLNLGGTAVPVLRLARLFGLQEATPGVYMPLLVLRTEALRLALVVDRVSRIASVPAEGILPVPAQASFNDCAAGVVTLDGHVIVLLSAERLLLDKEQQCLAELQDAEQARLRDLEGARP
jgi:purine-binding chemotaxis protein CheW